MKLGTNLKKFINATVSEFKLHQCWLAPRTNDLGVLMEHLNELCNENGLVLNAEFKVHRA